MGGNPFTDGGRKVTRKQLIALRRHAKRVGKKLPKRGGCTVIGGRHLVSSIDHASADTGVFICNDPRRGFFIHPNKKARNLARRIIREHRGR